MAGRIPQAFIDELLSRTDVVDVVDSRVKLKKAGKNYSACCPFHNENTPSFTVSREKQFYYCFGCGASGSALKFVMEFDGLSFPDAVEKLAASVGLDVPRDQQSQDMVRQQQEQDPLYRQLSHSSDFFSRQLRQHDQRQRAVDYLKSRGLSGKAAKFFAIGYAPPGWDNLLDALGHTPGDIKQLITSGMLIEKDDGRCYDRFRDRIMFPIRDIRGRVIAFGGRVLGDEKPKYLNSPETPIFQKNKELYGLYEARKIRQKLNRLMIVEGYMDVVALAEYGIHYAVATLGTATSEHHLRRLFKMVPELIFCFDGDAAGRTAAARAMETVLPILEDGLQARFLFLPDGEDPDTLIRQEGKEAFEQRLNQSRHLPEFLFDHLKQQVDFDSLDGKARLDQLAAPLISKIPRGTLRDLMTAELEKQLGVQSRAMNKINSADDDHTPPASQNHQPAIERHPHSDNVPAWLDDDTTDTSHSYNNQTGQSGSDNSSASDSQRMVAAVERALSALIRNPALASQLDPVDFEPLTEREQLLLEVMKKLHQSPQSSSVGLLIQWIGTPFHTELTRLANHNETPVRPVLAEVGNAIKRLCARQTEREYQSLLARYQHKESRRQMSADDIKQLKTYQRQRRELTAGRGDIYLNNPHQR
ncbi:DNA primase [Oceanobacter sp. 3_MG-2023]|uniref:DNA primase n=2 Tax=Gammaproteobacteria TaxID=1236 RepID=UPI0027324B46|nr:DNA primase [Oceanobacter sp. 3_MG-2023]MDP2506493.1 DNA primase [Oceanobacter sp. 3_MG-2023]